MFNFPGSNLYIGTMAELLVTNETEWAFVHATQTFHYQYFGWDNKLKKPNKYHSYYIVYEHNNHISLNWIFGDAFLYTWSGPDTFIKILDFIDKWIQEKKIFIHSDKGKSRAPTIALLYLAKRAKRLSNESFNRAYDEFINYYPEYFPGGIGEYVGKKWHEIY